jgi:hypothetical protein
MVGVSMLAIATVRADLNHDNDSHRALSVAVIGDFPYGGKDADIAQFDATLARRAAP